MATYRNHRRDSLGEMIEEARVVAEIGELGGRSGPVRGSELDALLEALVQAQQLRRRLMAQLEHQRRSGQGCEWAEHPDRVEHHPRRRATDREAS